MIALQSLKYKIFEWCLDTLVDKLVNTFFNDIGKNKIKLDECEIRAGMRIDEIVCVRVDGVVHIYRMCEIIDIGRQGVYFSAEMEKVGSEDWYIRYKDNSCSWSLSGKEGDWWGKNNGVSFYQYL